MKYGHAIAASVLALGCAGASCMTTAQVRALANELRQETAEKNRQLADRLDHKADVEDARANRWATIASSVLLALLTGGGTVAAARRAIVARASEIAAERAAERVNAERDARRVERGEQV